MRIEPRKELWKKQPKVCILRENGIEIWRPSEIDLERELIKYQGGSGRWRGGRRGRKK